MGSGGAAKSKGRWVSIPLPTCHTKHSPAQVPKPQASSVCPGGEKKPEAGLEQEAEAPALPQACCGSLFTAWLVKVRKDMVTGKRAWNYPHATQRERKFPRRENEENSNDFWMGGGGVKLACPLPSYSSSSRQTPQGKKGKQGDPGLPKVHMTGLMSNSMSGPHHPGSSLIQTDPHLMHIAYIIFS